MKKIFVLTIYVLLTRICSYSQVAPDSLTGTYTGIAYSKNLSTDPWTTMACTSLMVTAIDTINCKALLNGCGWPYPQWVPLFTNYTYCNTSVTGNYYAWFHNMDSITAIADSNTIPPPVTPSPFSFRFYGKRISNNTGLGIDGMKHPVQPIILYPNPSSTILYVIYKMFDSGTELQITDAIGKNVKSEKLKTDNSQINISDLENGIYFVKIKTEQGIVTKKIVLRH